MINTYFLEELNQEIWINGRAYPIPVVFDFSSYNSEFDNRVVIRLNSFDKHPILDNLDSREFGQHLFLCIREYGDNRNELVQLLAEFWKLDKTIYENGKFSYNLKGDNGYYPIALCIPIEQEIRIKTLICFGIKDGDSRGPDIAIIYKMAKITINENIENLFSP